MSKDNKTIEVYREKFDDYRNLTSTADFSMLNKFISHFSAGDKIYDVGAGPGHDAERMQQAGLTVVALEPTAEFADLIEERGICVERNTFSDIDAIKTYDGVWANFSLLHATRTDFVKHLGQIACALKPNGLFVMAMKTGTGEKRDDLGRFYSYYQIEELQQLLEDSGFRVKETHTGSGVGLAGVDDPYVTIWSQLA